MIAKRPSGRLRGNAEKHGIDPHRIAVWGSSAGGHLVSMLGSSGGVKELEGKLGKHLDQSSRGFRSGQLLWPERTSPKWTIT